MTSARINSRELTADHIGRTVSVVWPAYATHSDHDHSVTGELETVTQDRDGASGQLRVGALVILVNFGGPVEVHLHDHAS